MHCYHLLDIMKNYYIVINTIKEEQKISAFSALIAKAFKHYLLTYHRKLSVQLLRNFYVVILLILKVYDAVTLDASKMMMILIIGIVSFWLSVPLNNIDYPKF